MLFHWSDVGYISVNLRILFSLALDDPETHSVVESELVALPPETVPSSSEPPEQPAPSTDTCEFAYIVYVVAAYDHYFFYHCRIVSRVNSNLLLNYIILLKK